MDAFLIKKVSEMILGDEIPVEMICPDCGERLYPVFTDEIKNSTVSKGVVGECVLHHCTTCNKDYDTIPIPVIMDY